MQRQALENGSWFDLDRATKYAEGSRWDGSNNISLATGSQWTHETLYRTAGGRWVLNCWSQYQGSGETWTIQTGEAAAAWLIANEHEPPTDLADVVTGLEV